MALNEASILRSRPAAVEKVSPAPAPTWRTKPAPAVTHDTWKSTLQAFIKLGRPKFLPYSAILTLLGALYSSQSSGTPIDWPAYMVALSFIWVTHLQTHYNNEYFDLQADLANDTPTKWTGGSRVLVDGLLPTWSALAASVTLTVFGILSVWGAKWDSQPVVYIAIAIMTLAWSYTSPPVRLHYHSLGELTVATVLTVLTPLFGFATQPGTGKTWETFTMPSSLPYLLAILAIQQWARMVVMNIPDVEGDLRVSKITFAARIGVRNAANIYYAVQVLTPFLALIFLPWPLSCAFLSLSLYGLKAAKKVKLACNSGSWNHIDETVSIPFEATGHCAGTALACTTAMILLSLAGSKAGL